MNVFGHESFTIRLTTAMGEAVLYSKRMLKQVPALRAASWAGTAYRIR